LSNISFANLSLTHAVEGFCLKDGVIDVNCVIASSCSDFSSHFVWWGWAYIALFVVGELVCSWLLGDKRLSYWFYFGYCMISIIYILQIIFLIS